MSQKNAIQKIEAILINKIRTKVPSYVAIPFSGSLDSSLVALLVKHHTNIKPTLYTIGFPNCYDFNKSKKSAKLLQLKVRYVTLDNKILKRNLIEYLQLISDTDKVSISYTLPLYILLKEIKEKYIVTGHGADTLFGGFYKYLKVHKSKLKDKIKKGYLEFLDEIPKRELKIARKFNKELILPFANKTLADFVLTLPSDYFIRNGERKYLLRQVAKGLGMPEELIYLPKKAIQYSTGIMKRLQKVKRYRTLSITHF